MISFQERVDKMLEISEKYFNNDIEFIDIGGGFFSNMSDELKIQFGSDVPLFKDYAETVASKINSAFSSLNEYQRPELIIEPGSAIVADTMFFVAEVISVKQINKYKIATISGSKFNVTPQSESVDLPFKIISKTNVSKNTDKYLIAGYTCIESDYLSNEYEGIIKEGDFIFFENVGSYSIVLNLLYSYKFSCY